MAALDKLHSKFDACLKTSGMHHCNWHKNAHGGSPPAVSEVKLQKDEPLEIIILALFSIPRGKLPPPNRTQNLLEEKRKTSSAKRLISGNSLKGSKKTGFVNCHTARWTTKKPDLDNSATRS